MAAYLCACYLQDQKRQSMIRTQIPSICWTVSLLVTLAPTSCIQEVPETCTKLLAMWLVVGDRYLL